MAYFMEGLFPVLHLFLEVFVKLAPSAVGLQTITARLD